MEHGKAIEIHGKPHFGLLRQIIRDQRAIGYPSECIQWRVQKIGPRTIQLAWYGRAIPIVQTLRKVRLPDALPPGDWLNPPSDD